MVGLASVEGPQGITSIRDNLRNTRDIADACLTPQAPQAAQAQEAQPRDSSKERQDTGVSETARQRLTQLQKDLNSTLENSGENLLIQSLSCQLQEQATIPRAVATMELLGKNKANAIYKKLPQQAKSTVLSFLASPRYDRPKTLLMLEAGEELKSTLFSDELGQIRGELDPKISCQLVKFSDENMIELFALIEEAALPRAFLYFEPEQLARIVGQVQTSRAGEFARLAEAIAQIPLAKDKAEDDLLIKDAIRKLEKKNHSDSTRPFLDYYKSLLANVQPAVGDQLATTLSETDERFQTFIDENYISKATFFKLTWEIQDMILERVSIRNLGNFVIGLNEKERNVVQAILADARWNLVEEESQRHSKKSARQVQQIYWQGVQAVVDQIKSEKGEGSIRELFGDQARVIPNDG